MSFIGVPECGNVCAGPVVFSLSAPGPGLPSHKVPQPSTLDQPLQGPLAILRQYVWSSVGN